jgi:hypothetical protein
MQIMRVRIQTDENIHIFSYSAQQSKFENYLPTIKKMITSFKQLQFKQYENLDLGMRLKHSSSWNVSTVENDYVPHIYAAAQKITFYTVKENISNQFPIRFEILVSDEGQNIENSFDDLIKYH